jgi:hypothetical protein
MERRYIFKIVNPYVVFLKYNYNNSLKISNPFSDKQKLRQIELKIIDYWARCQVSIY